MLLLLPLLFAADPPRSSPSGLAALPALATAAAPSGEPTVRVGAPVSCSAPWTAPKTEGVPLVLVAGLALDALDATAWTDALAGGVRAAGGSASVDLAPVACPVSDWQQAWELAAFSGAAAVVWGRRSCPEPECSLMVQLTPGLAPRRWQSQRVPQHWEEPLLLDLFLFDLLPEQRAVVADAVAAFAAWTQADDASARALAEQALGRLEPGGDAASGQGAPRSRVKASLVRLQGLAALRATLPEAVFQAAQHGAPDGGPWQVRTETRGAHTIARLNGVDAAALGAARTSAIALLEEALGQCPLDDGLCRAHAELALERGQARRDGRRPEVARAIAEIRALEDAGARGASTWLDYARALGGRPHGDYLLDDPDGRLERPAGTPTPAALFGPPEAVTPEADRTEAVADAIRACHSRPDPPTALDCVQGLEDAAFSTPRRNVASFWAVIHADALEADGQPGRALEMRILSLKLAGGPVEHKVAEGIVATKPPQTWALLDEAAPFLSRRTLGVLAAELAVQAAESGELDRARRLWSESYRLAPEDGEAGYYRDAALLALLEAGDGSSRPAEDQLQLALLLSETALDPWLRIRGLVEVAEVYGQQEDVVRQRAALLAAGSFERLGAAGSGGGDARKRAEMLAQAAELVRKTPGQWTDRELEQAVFAVDQALDLLRSERPVDDEDRAGLTAWRADLHTCAGRLRRTLGQPLDAAARFDQARLLVNDLDRPGWEADLTAAAAAARLAADDPAAAEATFEEAKALAEASGDLDWATHLASMVEESRAAPSATRRPVMGRQKTWNRAPNETAK